jgi:hypothetical protein
VPLALLYLAQRLQTCQFLLQVVAVSPELQAAGEVTKVPAYTSDLIELVSGVCPVRLLTFSPLTLSTSHRSDASNETGRE